MQNVSEIFAIWPTDADLARDVGLSYATVSAWKQRGSIPAAYWRDLIRAARRRGHSELSADLLVDLHAREATAGLPGFGEEERHFAPHGDAAPRDEDGNAKPEAKGHFSRFKHLRRDRFRTAKEIEEHISALRDEWSHR